jgi:hypothetical protein
VSGLRLRDHVAAYWDEVIADWADGRLPHEERSELRRWFQAYSGLGRGAVSTLASPEPYIGPLSSQQGTARVVALGLNPGEADLAFQGPGGVFAREYVQLGGFSAWAVTAPYLREPWRSAHRRNRYHENLRTFARRWLQDPQLRSRDVLVFEMYPWHSDAVTGTIDPDRQVIDDFVWKPIAELDMEHVFAFGAPWSRFADRLRLPEHRTQVELTVPSRRVRVFKLASGQQLVVCWQSGYNGPPGAPDVAALRRGLRRTG